MIEIVIEINGNGKYCENVTEKDRSGWKCDANEWK